MIYVRCHSLDPCFNLALEEYLLSLETDEEIFCLWRNGPAVVSGRFQNIFAETDVPSAEDRGVAVIRRITGGGTVYHDGGNLNYTVIRNKDGNGLDYPAFIAPVAAALRELGAPAEIAGSCITVNGKKISGSAQTAVGNRVLHHGTLLYSVDLDDLRRFAAPPSACFSSRAITSNPAPVGNLIESLGVGADPEKFADEVGNIVSGGQSPQSPDSFDGEAIERLAGKYASWEWNVGFSPKFMFRGEKKTAKGTVRLSYTSAHGVIDGAEWTGPYEKEMKHILTGARLDGKSIRDAIFSETDDRSFADAAARFILSGK